MQKKIYTKSGGGGHIEPNKTIYAEQGSTMLIV